MENIDLQLMFNGLGDSGFSGWHSIDHRLFIY